MKQDAEKTTDRKPTMKPAKFKIEDITRNLRNRNGIIICSNKNELDVLESEAEYRLYKYEIQITKIRNPRIKTIGYEGNLKEEMLEKYI